MHPVDEADAFANLLQAGGTSRRIVDKTGLSAQTVKRRLALATLCPEARKALQSGAITLALAEALTVGSAKQQESILEAIDRGEHLEPEDVRHFLLREKPTVAMAIFPKEKYAGSITTDLFAADETTYFDDAEQFLALQKEAVEALAEEHRKTAARVEIFTSYTVPWWHYREAKKKEKSEAGVVISLHPSGSVEVRTGLIKHEVKEEVVAATVEAPLAPQAKERPAFSATLLRYVANHKSMAVQAALLRNPRKGREVAVLLLSAGNLFRHGVRLVAHPCCEAMVEGQPRAYAEIESAAANFAEMFGFPKRGDIDASHGIARLFAGDAVDIEVYERLGTLSDTDLDRLLLLLVGLCFGQDDLGAIDADQSLFNRVGTALAVAMRDWWTPDATFLGMLRREQLQTIAEDLGGAARFTGLKTWSKTELVQALARAFAAPTPPEGANGSEPRPFRSWLPGIFRFPAEETIKQHKE